MKPQICENGFHREIFISNSHELVWGLQTWMTDYGALFVPFVFVTILMSLWRFLHQNIDLFQHCCGQWCCKVVHACSSACHFVLFVCLYSWLCSRTSYTPVRCVCLCSSVLLWYVITPLTIGLAYILKRSHLWMQRCKGRTFLFLAAPI